MFKTNKKKTTSNALTDKFKNVLLSGSNQRHSTLPELWQNLQGPKSVTVRRKSLRGLPEENRKHPFFGSFAIHMPAL